MRTAIITAVQHDGKSVLLSGKEIPLVEQMKRFREARHLAVLEGAHEKYREISYQENDGHEEVLTFRTPEKQKEYLAQREKEKQQHAAQIAAEKEREGQSRIPTPVPAEKAAGNEFTLESLNGKNQGELLAIVNDLVTAGRIEKPPKTSKTSLVEAILSAKPVTQPSTP